MAKKDKDEMAAAALMAAAATLRGSWRSKE